MAAHAQKWGWDGNDATLKSTFNAKGIHIVEPRPLNDPPRGMSYYRLEDHPGEFVFTRGVTTPDCCMTSGFCRAVCGCILKNTNVRVLVFKQDALEIHWIAPRLLQDIANIPHQRCCSIPYQQIRQIKTKKVKHEYQDSEGETHTSYTFYVLLKVHDKHAVSWDDACPQRVKSALVRKPGKSTLGKAKDKGHLTLAGPESFKKNVKHYKSFVSALVRFKIGGGQLA